MNSIKRNLQKVKMLFFVSILLFTACEADDIKQIIEIDKEKITDIQYAIEDFDMSILLNAENPEVRSKAASLNIKSLRAAEVIFNVIPDNLNILPATGYDITIQAFGTFTNTITIRVTDYYNSTLITNAYIQGNGVTGGSVTFNIPPHFDKNGTPRYIMIEYMDDNLQVWAYLKVYAQEASAMLFESNINEYILQEGDTYTITQLGSYPSTFSEMVRFRAVTTNDVLVSSSTALIAYPMTSTTINIIENTTDLPRMVYIQYWIDDVGEWITFETWLQLGKTVEVIIQEAYADVVPAAESFHTIYFRGEFNAMKVRAKAKTQPYYDNNYTTPEVDAVKVSGTYKDFQYDGYATITFPAVGPYNGWTPNIATNINSFARAGYEGSWTIEYYNGKEWVEVINELGQENYFLKVVNQHAAITIPNSGGSWLLTISGHYIPSNIQLRPINISGTIIGPIQIATMSHGYSHTGGTGELINLQVYANSTSSPRTIYLQYSIDGGATWSTWSSYGSGRENQWTAYPTGLGNTVQQL